MQITRENTVQLVRIRKEAWAYADMGDGFLRLIVIEGNYDHDFFRIAEHFLSEGGDFLDAGANYGLLSFGLAKQLADRVRFHLFEPNPNLVPVIQRSAKLYRDMHLVVNQSAVSNFQGVIKVFFDETQTGASHFDPVNGQEVPCVTIDQYLEAHNIGTVPLLKLDVEGYELVALKGAAQSIAKAAIRAIYFEYFEKWLQRVQPPSELLHFLRKSDYEVYFCREHDLARFGGPTHQHRAVAGGKMIPLRAVGDGPLPSMTDLLALPKAAADRI
jgi:FkbM family methyltransferase